MNEPLRTDGELLAEFADAGNEPAFAELMARHGPMAYGVALRVLADHHEAQDVAQAAFCTLARKARSIRKDASVGGWLHRVAWCLAVDVKSSRASRQRREEATMQAQADTVHDTAGAQGFREELDAALNQLPERYRQPLVLFHIEGHSLDVTARTLGLKSGTVGSQLARAREMLRQKLVRRGVGVASVGALTALLSAEAGAAVLPATFVSATVKAAGLAAAGKLAAGVTAGMVSANVAALTKGAVKMILVAKMKMVAAAVVACALTAGTVAVVAQQQQAAAPAQAQKWMTTTEGGQVDINPTWGTFDRLDKTGELVILVRSNTGQSVDPNLTLVEVRLKIADGREDMVRKAAAALAKGAEVKVGCVRDSATRERFVWELAAI
jgi:RNA polymerase sigma factor (sigma-70 family)